MCPIYRIRHNILRHLFIRGIYEMLTTMTKKQKQNKNKKNKKIKKHAPIYTHILIYITYSRISLFSSVRIKTLNSSILLLFTQCIISCKINRINVMLFFIVINVLIMYTSVNSYKNATKREILSLHFQAQ